MNRRLSTRLADRDRRDRRCAVDAARPRTAPRRAVPAAGIPRIAVREVHAAERARGDPQPEPHAADGGGEPLVPRRPGERGSRAHRLRAPVRAHDVPELEARAARLAPSRCSKAPAPPTSTARPTTTAPTTSRPSRRTSSSSRCGSSPIAWATCSTRSTRRRSPTSRTSCATSGGRASRTSRTGWPKKRWCSTLFPKGHPYYGNVIGSHEDIQAAKLDDVQALLPASTTRRTTPAWRSSATSTRRRRRRWSRSTSAR